MTEYNKKGDEAIVKNDYADALLWYGEGVSLCDMYSIRQLTAIWKENEAMQQSMRSLMIKCLNCLTVSANNNDTTAMNQLIEYYRLGIGTAQNRDLYNHWSRRLNNIRSLGEYEPPKPPLDIHYFGGYLFSLEAPLGINVGMIFNRVGFYLRYKTNFSTQKFDYTYKDGEIEEFTKEQFYEYNKKKVNYYAISGGLVVKCTPWLLTSVGAGYFNRELLYSYNEVNDNGSFKQELWAKNPDKSYDGIIADLDFIVPVKSLYLSAGVSTLSFKYVDLNVGIGVFF